MVVGSSAPAAGPPDGLVRALLRGPSRVVSFEWHDEVGSTNALAAEAAAAGAPEITLIGADVQHSGRGRMGRAWHAPSGTSLQVSFLLRPEVADSELPLASLMAGVALAEVARGHLPETSVGLKWPNDLLVDGRKAAGILVERVAGAVVVGIGVNVDWREVERPAELAFATSLAEAAGRSVDRWKVLAGLAGVLDRKYDVWQQRPVAILDDYRRSCATLGQRVRVDALDGARHEGVAVEIAEDGALRVKTADGMLSVRAGDVAHLRPA